MDFPSLTNFLVCCVVTLSGLYWLRTFSEKDEAELRYVFRAYVCWWLSWFVWSLTWGIIALTEWEKTHQREILALSDLNTILLIAVYFFLTRGNPYKLAVGFIDIVYLCAITASGYLVFFYFLPERFDHLQMGWGLCLSAISTILVGWAFAYRYKTRAVLVIGFVYAFAQPVAFDAILHDALADRDPQAAVAIISGFKFALAIFKILWATAATLYFTQVPVTKENIAADSVKGSWLPPLKAIPRMVYVQTAVLLITVSVVLAILGLERFPLDRISPVLAALGALVAIIVFLGRVFHWIRDQLKEKHA